MTGVKPGTVILGVVSMCAIAAGLLMGLAVTGHLDSSSTPILTVVLGFMATTVTSLVAVLKVDSISHELRNGLIESKVSDALDTAASNAADTAATAAASPVATIEKGGNDGGQNV